MFDRVAIVGVGLLGASLGLAIKATGAGREVVGVGRPGSASLEVALQRKAIDSAYTDVGSAIAGGADLVVLCTPVRQFPEAMKQLQGKLARGSIVTDVGSTKAQVMTWANEFFAGDPALFVGSHPMAGSEKRGPGAARADLYEGGLCLLCEPAVANPAALAKVEMLWQKIGMRTLKLDAAAHDRWVATVSHLPHAIAFALVNAAASHPERLAAAAGGFFDTTRIASSDVEMWTDIFLTNREAVSAAIDEFSASLGKLKAAVAAGDERTIRETVTQAKATRDSLLARRRGEQGSGK